MFKILWQFCCTCEPEPSGGRGCSNHSATCLSTNPFHDPSRLSQCNYLNNAPFVLCYIKSNFWDQFVSEQYDHGHSNKWMRNVFSFCQWPTCIVLYSETVLTLGDAGPQYNSLKPVVRPSFRSSIHWANHIWAQRPYSCRQRFQPSAGARKKPPVGRLNF